LTIPLVWKCVVANLLKMIVHFEQKLNETTIPKTDKLWNA